MPVQVDVYRCPMCERDHISEEAAEECAEECLRDHIFMPEEGYACARCGELNKSKAFAIRHEQVCKNELKDNDESWLTCVTCNHMDAEGLRHSPCREYHHAPMRAACEHFELATK